jgi:hypothetical protein
MEKIVSGMFLRKTNFEDLQRMVVSCIAEGPGQIALSTERKKIESWPEHYEAYREVMQEAPRMEDVLAAEMRLLASEAELGRLHARLRRLHDHMEEASRRNRANRERLTQEADEAEALARRQIEQLEGERDAARREAEDREGRVAELQKQEQRLCRSATCPPRRSGLPTSRACAMNGNNAINASWPCSGNSRIFPFATTDSCWNSGTASTRNASGRSGNARSGTGLQPAFRDLEQAKDQALTALREAHRQAREQVDQRLAAVLGEEGGWKEKARNPQAAADILAAHQAKRDAVAQADEGAGRRPDRTAPAGKTAQRGAPGLRGTGDAPGAVARPASEAGGPACRPCACNKRRGRTACSTSCAASARTGCSTSPRWCGKTSWCGRTWNPNCWMPCPASMASAWTWNALDAHLAADEQGLQREAAEVEARLHSADAAIVKPVSNWTSATSAERRHNRPWLFRKRKYNDR